MFKDIENLKIKNISKGESHFPGSVKSRKMNAFVFRIRGACRYNFKDTSLDVHSGELIFLPKGSAYEVYSTSDTQCEHVSISFDADLTSPTPSVYSFDDYAEREQILSTLHELWKFGGQTDIYKCYALFYDFLTYISNIEKLNYADKKKLNLISPAVDYIKKHIYDADLKTDNLHQLCGVSGTYFRKIFLANFGTNPQSYILKRRLSHAKALLDSGDFSSIAEVAASVGYTDPLYFSRAFKKKYGIAPSKYANEL